MKTAIIILSIAIVGLGIIVVMQWNIIKKLSPEDKSKEKKSSNGSSFSLGEMAEEIQKNGGNLKLEATF